MLRSGNKNPRIFSAEIFARTSSGCSSGFHFRAFRAPLVPSFYRLDTNNMADVNGGKFKKIIFDGAVKKLHANWSSLM